MKQKTKIDLIYSGIAILDISIVLPFVLLTGGYVPQNVPENFFGFLLVCLYAIICLGSCVVRMFYLWICFFAEMSNLEQKIVCKTSRWRIYLCPVFAIITCVLSLAVTLF